MFKKDIYNTPLIWRELTYLTIVFFLIDISGDIAFETI